MKVSFIALAVFAAAPAVVSAESLRKPSDIVTKPTPKFFTPTIADLTDVQRRLKELDPDADPLPINMEDLLGLEDLIAAGSINPASYTTWDDYAIHLGKCMFFLQLADAKTDGQFGFVDHYGPLLCGTKMPTSAPVPAPSKAPVDLSSAPSKHPTDVPTDMPTKNPVTDSPSKNPTENPTDMPTKNPVTDSPSKNPTENPTDMPTKNPIEASLSPSTSSSPSFVPSPSCLGKGETCTASSECCQGDKGLEEENSCCRLNVKVCGYDGIEFGNYDCTDTCDDYLDCIQGVNGYCSNRYRQVESCSSITRPSVSGQCQDYDAINPSGNEYGFCRRALREGEDAVSDNVPLERRLQIIKDMEHLGAKHDASFSFTYDLISKESCNALIKHMDSSLECDIDAGIELPVGASSHGAEEMYESWTPFEGGVSNQYNKKLYADQIVDLIGADETTKIIEFFHKSLGEDLNIDCMYLARHGDPGDDLFNVPWHKDNYATLEITLNDDYDGGEVLHLNAAGVHKTDALPGSATAHTVDVVHGITPNHNGAKYMLILKHHFERPEKQGVVRLSRELVANASSSRA